jgi:hypothetical protein
MESRSTPWEGRTFVYTQLTQLGESALFLQMHAQGRGLVYEVLRLEDAPAPFSLADAEGLAQALREHVRLMVETEPQDAPSEEGDP